MRRVLITGGAGGILQDSGSTLEVEHSTITGNAPPVSYERPIGHGTPAEDPPRPLDPAPELDAPPIPPAAGPPAAPPD